MSKKKTASFGIFVIFSSVAIYHWLRGPLDFEHNILWIAAIASLWLLYFLSIKYKRTH